MLAFFTAVAPYGQQFVDALARSAASLAQWLASAQGQTAIKEFFAAIVPLVQQVAAAIPPLVVALLAFTQTVAPALTAIISGISTFLGWLRMIPGELSILTAAWGLLTGAVDLVIAAFTGLPGFFQVHRPEGRRRAAGLKYESKVPSSECRPCTMPRRVRRAALIALSLVLLAPASAEAHSLTYGRVKAAAQAKGNAIARQQVRVFSVLRRSYGRHGHRYQAQVSWSRVNPTGCQECAVAPDGVTLIDLPTTESCSADLRVRFRSARSRSTITSVVSRSCF